MRALNLNHVKVKEDVMPNPVSPTPSPANDRCYYVDWVRIAAMLAVFILHSSHFFDESGWHVKDQQTYFSFTVLLFFIHQWTMPLFFLLSGAASWFTLERRTGKEYASARFKRLLIPYIFGIFVIIPPQKFLEAVNQGGYTGNFFNFLGNYFTPGTLWIDTSLRFFGHFGYHLWFLGYLLVFSLAALPLFKLLKQEKSRRWFSRWGDFFSRPGRIFLLSLPVAIAQIALRPLFPNYLHWADTLYWAIFFFYGYLIFSHRPLEQTLQKHWKTALAIGICCFTLMLPWALWGNLRALESHPGYTLSDILYQLLRGINTWAWVVFLLGVTKKLKNKNSKTLTYSNDALLPFYILHQTVILIIGFYVIQLNLPVLAKFAVILCTAFIATLGLYELIKRFAITRFLFGMKRKYIL